MPVGILMAFQLSAAVVDVVRELSCNLVRLRGPKAVAP